MKQEKKSTVDLAKSGVKNVILLGLISCFADISTEMVYPLIPLYLTTVLGATPAIVGIIEGIAESLASLLKVFSGYISDKYQNKKKIAFAGYATGLLYKLALLLAGSWAGILISRVIDRFGKGIRTAPRDVMVSESSQDNNLGRTFGIHKALDMLGSAIGILSAFLLLKHMGNGTGAYRVVFLVSIVPILIALCLFGFVKEQKRERPASFQPFWKERVHLDGQLKLYLFVVTLFTLGNSSNTFLLLRANSIGIDSTDVIFLYFIYNAVASVLAIPMGKRSDKKGRKNLLICGYLLFSVVYLLFGFAPSKESMVVAFVLYGIYTAMIAGVERAFLAEISPAHLKGTILGLHGTLTGIALLPASVIAGFLWNHISSSAPFVFGAVLSAIAALLLLFGMRSGKKSNAKKVLVMFLIGCMCIGTLSGCHGISEPGNEGNPESEKVTQSGSDAASENTEKDENIGKGEDTEKWEDTENLNSEFIGKDEPVIQEPEPDTPAYCGALQVVGNRLCDKYGDKVYLHGLSTHGIAWFPDYVNEAAFKEFRNDWNANVIRLAMYTAEYGGYCAGGNKEQLKTLIRNGVEYATKNDLYVIVDWHILSDGNPNTYKSQAIEFFREMSKEFADHNNVLYEICNEPNSGTSWKEIKAYAEEVIPVIRENDKDAIIIVGTPNWCQSIGDAAADPIQGYDNIMYAVHFYAATHTDWLRNDMVKAVDAGLPVFVTEFGICDASGNGAIDEYQASEWIRVMNENAISYCGWNISNKNETSAIFKSGCNKTSGWTENDLSASGKWMYEMLRNTKLGD